ncbi:hypothetical protein [Corynebacterium accolens]|uniref:hypothetical protein n=1 Tax=Corynebacterium accolens TaxID=38284 RepID=UPI00254F65D7|nr:hypothetical protein [Corynebacterium accolens]MDK8680207.1 hypothetical protein [Corynebacterium accolens]
MSAETQNFRIPYPTTNDKVHELPRLLKTLSEKLDSEIHELYKVVSSKNTPPPVAAPAPTVEKMQLNANVEAIRTGNVVAIRNKGQALKRNDDLKDLPEDWRPADDAYMLAPYVKYGTLQDMVYVKVFWDGKIESSGEFNGTVTYIAKGS